MKILNKISQAYMNLALIVRILLGLILGVLLGLLFPSSKYGGMVFVEMLGTVFVGALKGVAPILVFVLVISSIACAGKNIGRRFAKVVALYMSSTFLAAVFAVVACFAFKVTISLNNMVGDVGSPPDDIGAVIMTLVNNMVQNPIAAIMNANYVGIITWASIIGVALKTVASQNTKAVLADISAGVSKVVSWVVQFAPFGIMGLVFTSVGEYGMEIFTQYGYLLLLLVGCMVFVYLVINPLIVFLCLHENPYPLILRCFRDSGVPAFFTRSSAANIFVNMDICKKLKLDEEYYSVSIPLGATINMDGAAITVTVMSLTAAFSCGIEVNIFLAILLCFIATLGACGASGVAGGSLLLIPMACSLLGVPSDVAMSMVGVGFIIGVIQDSLETALNSSGDVIFTATAEFMEWKKHGKALSLNYDA